MLWESKSHSPAASGALLLDYPLSPTVTMSDTEKTAAATPTNGAGDETGKALAALKHADDALLAKLGYKSEFKREFSVSPRRSIASPQKVRTLKRNGFSSSLRQLRLRSRSWGSSLPYLRLYHFLLRLVRSVSRTASIIRIKANVIPLKEVMLGWFSDGSSLAAL